MKGITPVVAVTLLIAVTVAATGTFYSVYTDTQREIQENAPDITFDTDKLHVESCWSEGSGPYNVSLSIRNKDDTNSINNSKMDVIVDGQELDYDLDPEGLIGPQQTFEVRFEGLSSPGTVEENETKIFLGESSMTYICFN
ncbi:MAG: archaellin/type IV pilin N-terminal domain-containing protein [Candidatus Nanohaloarchaea archaeon]